MSRRGSGARIYIGNLPEEIVEEDLEHIFYKFGRIRTIDIKSARSMSGSSYAFLEFQDSRQAEDAVENRNGYRYEGNRLRVEFTGDRRPKRNYNKSHGPPKRSSYRVYVTGLPQVASWQDLKDHMRKAGPVGYANIERRVGVVEYETKEDMERSLRKLDKSEFKNMFDRCEIRVTRDKDSIYKDSYRSYSRDRRYKYSRSRSRSRSSYRSPRSSKSYSVHSYHSKHRYSNNRSASYHRSHAMEDTDYKHTRNHSRSSRSYTPPPQKYSRSPYSVSHSNDSYRDERKHDKSPLNENGHEEYKKSHSPTPSHHSSEKVSQSVERPPSLHESNPSN